MVHSDVAYIFHVETAGLLVVLIPAVAVEFDYPIVVRANPEGVALGEEAVDKLVLELFVEIGIVRPAPVAEAVEALGGANPQVASVVDIDGKDVVARQVRVFRGVVGPFLGCGCGGEQQRKGYSECLFHSDGSFGLSVTANVVRCSSFVFLFLGGGKEDVVQDEAIAW